MLPDPAAVIHKNGSLGSCLARLRASPPSLGLAVCLTIVFAIRCFSLLHHYDMGCDIANYLDTTNTFFGQDPTGFGLDRPPLIALPLKLFTLVFGDLTGVKLLGILVSVGIGIPFYLLAKRVSPGWIASAVTLLFVLTPAYSDMLTWGYLSMFGILFGLLTLHCLLQVLEEPSKASIFLTGLFASLVVGFHQLSLAFFIPFFLIVTIGLFALNRQAFLMDFKALLAAVAIAVVLSLPYLPVYLRMLELQAPATSQAAFSLAPSFVPWLLGIVITLPLVVLALRWTWQQNRNIAIIASVLLLYSLTLTIFVFPSPFLELNRRAHYFMYPAIWLLASVVLSHLWSWQEATIPVVHRRLPKSSAIALAVALLFPCLVMSQLKLNRGQDVFGYLDNVRWETLARIRSDTPTDASIAVYPNPLGWWIEAESRRNTAYIANRDTVPYTFLRERSLIAERVLSRNQGFENGNLRLATTYPYSGAPGQPVLGVYVDGSYHDIMMFDDSTISLSMADGEVLDLDDDSEKEFSISGDRDSMTMMTRYLIGSAQVVQTATLDRGSQAAAISYNINSDGIPVTDLDILVFFGFEPQSVSIASDQTSVEVAQFLRPGTDGVVTRINISVEGATVQQAVAGDDRIGFSFSLQSDDATIAFSFDVAKPELDSDADVIRYDVPEIIKNPGLEHLSAIDYLAVDLKPNPNLASAIAWGTEEWLNACPYYKLVYREGDIRIYKVDASALP
jgi:hypothetical protein